jgi:sentrin-specific protease 1
MTSFFYHRLLQEKGVFWTGKPEDQPEVYNYDNVKKYTKTVKGGITTLERIYFPIHVKGGIGHWLLIVVYMLLKEVHFYDSCGGRGLEYFKHIMHWIGDEMEKENIQLDESEWGFFSPEIPRQKNGVDCGIFVIVLADYLSDNLDPNYSQDMMPYLRLKIGTDIIRGRFLY